MPLPPKQIPFEKRNNEIYIEVQEPIKNTLVTLRYFTQEQGCGLGYYFKTESIIPLANIRSNPYKCVIKRKSNGTSHITFTHQGVSHTISAEKSDTFVVHPESDKIIRITKKESDTVVAEFTIK